MNKQSKEDKITELMAEVLEVLGENIEGEHMRDTPRRFAKALISMSTENAEVKKPKISTFEHNSNTLVVVRNIEVRSLCRHHLFPFWGEAEIAYIPMGKKAGLSKFQRAMDYVAERPQDQENITEEFLNFLVEEIEPLFMVVKIKAVHSCMSVRGVKCSHADTITIAHYQVENTTVNGYTLDSILSQMTLK